MNSLTKIIATIGPMSQSSKVIRDLIVAGTSIFRLNASHGDFDLLVKCVKNIREVSSELGVFSAILLDLKGPKIRLGKLPEPIKVKCGDRIQLAAFEHTDCLMVSYPNLAQDVAEGQTLLIDDGLVALKVCQVEHGIIYTEVQNEGELKSLKGINLVGGGLNSGAIAETDHSWIHFACEQKVDYLGLSFVRDASDFSTVRQIAKRYAYQPRLIAKIERQEAIDNLETIIQACDAVMIARGDLAVEVGHESVPLLQKRMIRLARSMAKPVIVATQMLESMVSSPIPTRAEVSDVANAVLANASAVMLSAESAVGSYPVESVKMMSSICSTSENDETKVTVVDNNQRLLERAEGIVEAVATMISQMPIRAIVCITETGHMARRMSSRVTGVPIFGFSSKPQTCRWMALYYAVYAIQRDLTSLTEQWELTLIESLHEYLTFSADDYIIVTRGDAYSTHGRTNQIKLICMKDYEALCE